MQSPHYDLIIVGAGILGSFHVYHAAQKGLTVLLLEKDPMPVEATVRNFGQVVPSGMSQGKWQQYGRRSLEIYKSIQEKINISIRQNGSVYIASDETELTLLQELAVINQNNQYPSRLLSPKECLENYPGLKADYCRGALFFPGEITAEPHQLIYLLLHYLQEQLSVTYRPNTLVTFCDYVNGKCVVEDNFGAAYTSDKVIICNGRDFKNLFAELFYKSDIEVSKLQMMKTIPIHNYSLNGSILTGLSIRRYESFKECPSYQALQADNIEDRFKKWGIHILFKQAVDGSIIIGDSHEYADASEAEKLGFAVNHEINSIILEEAKRIMDLPTWEIASSWNGYYAQCKEHDIFNYEVATNIHIITAIGGKGMTANAGLAETTIQQLF